MHRFRTLTASLQLGLLLVLGAAPARADVKPVVTGFYELKPSGPVDLTGDAGLTNPNCDGFRLRYAAEDLQSGPYTYDFSNIAAAIAIASNPANCDAMHPHGKKIAFSVTWGQGTPAGYYSNGFGNVYPFPLDVSDDGHQGAGTIPIPWDTRFQTYAADLISHLGAAFDGNPALTYIVISVGQTVTAYSFINDVDASAQLSVSTTSGSAAVTATTGTFITTGSTDAGLPISGDFNDTTFRGNTHILSITDTTHATLDKTALATTTNHHLWIWNRPSLYNAGDYSKWEAIARDGVSGWTNLPTFSDATPGGITPTSSAGYAIVAALRSASTALTNAWIAAFPTTTLYWTYSEPFPKTDARGGTVCAWATRTAGDMRDYLFANDAIGGGFGTSLAAIVPYPTPSVPTTRKGEQQVDPSSFADNIVYADPVPVPSRTPPHRLEDVMLTAKAKNDTHVELYNGDQNPDPDDLPGVAMLTYLHSLFMAPEVPAFAPAIITIKRR